MVWRAWALCKDDYEKSLYIPLVFFIFTCRSFHVLSIILNSLIYIFPSICWRYYSRPYHNDCYRQPNQRPSHQNHRRSPGLQPCLVFADEYHYYVHYLVQDVVSVAGAGGVPVIMIVTNVCLAAFQGVTELSSGLAYEQSKIVVRGLNEFWRFLLSQASCTACRG